MPSEDESSKGFKIQDRRRFSAEGELKPEFSGAEEPATAKPAAAKPDAPHPGSHSPQSAGAHASAQAHQPQEAAASGPQQAAAAEATNKRLEAQLHERLAAAEQSIDATRTAAMGHVGTIAADTASAIVERLIGQAPAEHEVAAALGDALKR